MNKIVRNVSTFLSTLVVGTALLAGAPAQAASSSVVSNGVLATMFASTQTLEGKVNINTASAKELELLPGIGPAMAQKIISYRAKQKFGDTLHLMRIKGIGRKTYNKLQAFLAVDGETTLRAVKSK